jgi:medium-chain acyl-[acyl-carrier-protein] hydrolase
MSRPKDDARWLKRFRRTGSGEVRLFCFHHAGGTASMYRHWQHLLPPPIEPVAVQLPGRGDRITEPPFHDMTSLVDALVEVLRPALDRPFACYGLSMGARVAWVLTHALRERGMPIPVALYLASTAAPECAEGRDDWRDDDVLAYLRDMGATPPEVFAEPELLAALLPTLRADLTLVDTFRFHPETPLDVPIRAFAGIDDIEGPPERMRGWGKETRAAFRLDLIPGGHFFDDRNQRRVIEIITDDLLGRHHQTKVDDWADR